MRSVELRMTPRLDPNQLAIALSEADIPVLLMVLVHLTGQDRWLEPPFQPERDGRLFAEESGGLSQDIQDEVRGAVLRCLTAKDPQPRALTDEMLQRMLSVAVGEPVPPEYLPLVMEDVGLRPPPPGPTLLRDPTSFHVTVIGAGLSGVCAAIYLKTLGVPFTVLEKNASVGGTWYENTYPEAGVDTPNHFYSFSFASQWRWTSYFSKQHEILAYIEHCVDHYGLREAIVLNAEADTARYDEPAQLWDVTYTTTADGAEHHIESNVIITAVGQVNTPKLPAIEDLDSFQGELFHTARWPPHLDLAGKDVAMVGTGASSVQAARSIAAEARSVTIYQRSPQWIMPNPDYHRKVTAGKQYLLENVPFYASWYRFGLFWRYADGVHSSLVVDPDWPNPERAVNAINDRHRGFLTRYMQSQLADRPDLLGKTVPTYPPYGKRMVVDNDWFKTLKRSNVSLVPDAVVAATETGLVTADGQERSADVVVLATGFQATRMLWPLQVLGRGGVSIHDAWNDDEPQSYLGMTTFGFPNVFMLLGPTTALAHGGSVIFHVEAQMRYISVLISRMVNNNIASIECTEAACVDYTARAAAAHKQLVFSHPGMNNWYKNRAGQVVTVSPWRLVDYWWMTRVPDLTNFLVEPTQGAPAPRPLTAADRQ
jgi:4-hydroxyacetophenone monooxygenase